jgi:2-methylcitrate dehydratase PrpD
MTTTEEREAVSPLGTLAEWAAGLELDALPSEVVHFAKRCILDALCVAFAGSVTNTAALCRAHASQAYASGESSVINARTRLTAPGAAFANGVATHALDFDDTSYAAILHSSALVLPAVLAVAEQQGLSGGELVTSFVVGTEVELTLGLALGHRPYLRGWLMTSVLGVVGAAAGAARALGLASSEIRDALSVAIGQTGGMQSCLGSPVKPYYAGRASQAGVTAATLVALGLAHVGDTFSRPLGFVDLFADGAFDERVLTSVGVNYAIREPGVCLKRYPVCSAAQAAVEALEAILAEGVIAREEVTRVVCTVPALVKRNLCFPAPTTVEQAQFSLPFAIGALLSFGELTPRCLRDDVLQGAELRAAAAKVELVSVPDEDWDGGTEGAEVTVIAADGRSADKTVSDARGSATRPMSDDDLAEKARLCLADALGDAEAARLQARVASLEQLASVRDLLTCGTVS